MDDSQAPGIAGYDVGRLLGRGGSADVWLATEQRTGKRVAVKCFRAGADETGNPAVGEEELRRELRILSVLDHPHLIRAHDAVRVDGPGNGLALTMDYAAGGSLAQLVRARGSLSVGETVTVLTPIAQALGYLHGKGFTHSDVAPGNVLFTGQGKPMLSDVGVARMIGDPGSTLPPGTRGFLDPAPVDAVRAGLQPERDVYAAAALGWFCLTGAAPGRTAGRPPLSLLVPGVPRELALALEAGLHEDWRQRPTAMALATAVYRSAAPLPVDLADAVHPTVIPELLTRRRDRGHEAAGGRRAKLRGLVRRAATSRLSRLGPPARSMPFPQPEPPSPRPEGIAPVRGKHAVSYARVSGGSAARARLLAAVPVVAAAGAAVSWLLAAPGGGPGFPAAGPGPAPATTLVAGPGGDGETGTHGRQSDAARTDAALQQARSADPLLAVAGLAALRDQAFSSGKAELLDAVNAAGSPAAAADQRISAGLDNAGLRLDGFASSVSAATVEDGATGARAVVALTSATSGYRTLDADGAAVATGAPGPAQRLRLVLVRVDGQWLISEIHPGA
ncbi:serine/threonine-protein kinase [Arthrobacter sp. C152]